MHLTPRLVCFAVFGLLSACPSGTLTTPPTPLLGVLRPIPSGEGEIHERVFLFGNTYIDMVCLQVISQIVGDTPLPWEDPATAPAILKRFGLFKAVILELLERDPDARPSMIDFMRSCRQVLALTTSNR